MQKKYVGYENETILKITSNTGQKLGITKNKNSISQYFNINNIVIILI